LREGHTQVEIAAHLNVAQATVSRWFRLLPKARRRRRKLTPEAVAAHLLSPEARLARAHRPRFLTTDQIRQVRSQKKQWKAQEFADALCAAYGVRYSRNRASDLLAGRREGASA
jgi:transposase